MYAQSIDIFTEELIYRRQLGRVYLHESRLPGLIDALSIGLDTLAKSYNKAQ